MPHLTEAPGLTCGPSPGLDCGVTPDVPPDADAHDLMVLALARSEAGDFVPARALLDRARAMEPDNPAILTGLAVHLLHTGALRDGVLACDAAIRAWPTYPDAWRQRGAILAAGGSSAAARESFTQAIRLAPQDAAAHAGLAALNARENHFAEARAHAEAALAIDPRNLVAACALGSALISVRDAAAALALLEPLVQTLTEPGQDRSLAWGIIGNAHHQLGQHDQAYAAFARCKDDYAVLHRRAAGDRLTHREFITAIEAGLRATDAALWTATASEPVTGAAAAHVFLLGYPRSGTTLMENILASLPGVFALEERPTLGDTDQRFLSGDAAAVAQGIGDFARSGAADLAALRSAYWNRVITSGMTPGAAGFIDMDPLKGTRLPLIARLFPQARVLIMRRDPRDVVWSCFRTNFAPSSGAYDFTSLERAARHYDSLMRLTELCRERLPLATHEVHYHELVRDFDATVRAACAFAGLPWDPAVREFDRTARERGVSTASAGQVRKGLYDGTGQWRPYARFLEPVMPVLAPWIERFGYDGESGT